MSFLFKKAKPEGPNPSENSNSSPTASSASSVPSGSDSSLPSVQKILPSSSESTSHKILDRSPSSASTGEIYKPFITEYALMTEFVLLHKQNIGGVYVVPSAGSALKWFGVIFIRQGLYQGGIYRFTLYIPDNFPDCDCPIIVFEPPVFHPLIDCETGELDVKRSFTKWRRNSNHLWQVIMFARGVFYKIDTHTPLNPEAAVLYEKDPELYKLRIAENMNSCHEHLYDKPSTEDNHAIFFSPWDPTIHADIRQKVISKKSPTEEDYSAKGMKPGLSWMEKGANQIFTKKEL